ncbi:MAG: c-type cytochrome [Acidimicrobiia bacterium]|nr:c-type cytochrome [Acidimicrobiia bacterium]
MRLLMVLASCLLLAACNGVAEDASGAEIFEHSCASCHSQDASGGVGPPLNAGSNASEQPDSFLTETITRGRGSMPAFDFTEEQLQRLVEHLRSLP